MATKLAHSRIYFQPVVQTRESAIKMMTFIIVEEVSGSSYVEFIEKLIRHTVKMEIGWSMCNLSGYSPASFSRAVVFDGVIGEMESKLTHEAVLEILDREEALVGELTAEKPRGSRTNHPEHIRTMIRRVRGCKRLAVLYDMIVIMDDIWSAVASAFFHLLVHPHPVDACQKDKVGMGTVFHVFDMEAARFYQKGYNILYPTSH